MSEAGGARTSPIRVERVGAGGRVARVVLARPERRNALDATTIAELTAVFAGFRSAATDQLRAVVLAGDGPAFCAGGDVAWMRAAMALSPVDNVADALALAEMYATIDACPVPVVARVQGAALGGGAGLCVVADVVVAESGARFGFPEVRLGLIPATIAPFVVRRIGEGAARALFATGERVDADEARRIGIAHRIVDGEAALDEAVDAILADILAGGPEAVRAAKALIRDAATGRTGHSHGGAPEADAELAAHTAELLAERRASAEAAEGLAAFDLRRRPAWAPPEDAS